MAQSELLRLVHIEVDGLFRFYDHRIDLDLHTLVPFLYESNGVGKTSIFT